MFNLEDSKERLRSFFKNNKETTYTTELISALDNNTALSSSMFMQLEKVGLSKDFKENLILLLKIKIFLSIDNDVLIRTLNQMSFVLEGIKIK